MARTLTYDKHGNADFGDHHWSVFGECADVEPDVMFPGPKNARAIATAKAVCAGCPFAVQQKCIEERTKKGDTYGVWGGMTEDDRQARYRRELRRRNAATASASAA